jgi:hypothetical protein
MVQGSLIWVNSDKCDIATFATFHTLPLLLSDLTTWSHWLDGVVFKINIRQRACAVQAIQSNLDFG